MIASLDAIERNVVRKRPGVIVWYRLEYGSLFIVLYRSPILAQISSQRRNSSASSRLLSSLAIGLASGDLLSIISKCWRRPPACEKHEQSDCDQQKNARCHQDRGERYLFGKAQTM